MSKVSYYVIKTV